MDKLKKIWIWMKKHMFGTCSLCQGTGYTLDDYNFHEECRKCRDKLGNFSNKR